MPKGRHSCATDTSPKNAQSCVGMSIVAGTARGLLLVESLFRLLPETWSVASEVSYLSLRVEFVVGFHAAAQPEPTTSWTERSNGGILWVDGQASWFVPHRETSEMSRFVI